MTCELTIRSGDDAHWLARPDALPDGTNLDANWNCKAGVYGTDGSEQIAPFTVSTTYFYPEIGGDQYFLISLSDTQTQTLGVGNYVLAVEVWNDVVQPVFKQETHRKFRIVKQLIT